MTARPGFLSRASLSLALLLGGAGQGFALDLSQAYRMALASDPQVAGAQSTLEAARRRVDQARGVALLPGASASVQINRNQLDTNAYGSLDYTNRVYAVNLTYPLYRPQNLTQLEQSRLQVQIGEMQLDQARQAVMVQVAAAYFDVLAAQDALATVRAQRHAITEQLAAARRNYEVGNTTITDQQEAQARADLNASQLVVVENDLAIKRAALALLIGQPLSPLNGLDGAIALAQPQPVQESAWTDSARQSNLAVVQAQVNDEIARREIERRRYGHYPTLDVVGSYQRQENPSPVLLGFRFNGSVIGLQLNIPIYSGGTVDAQVREAAALSNRAQSDLDNARRQAEQTARTAFLGVSSGLSQVRALEAAEKSSRLALESNQLGYQVGVRINIDVLNAQQQLYSTQRDLSRARYDVLVNGLRLRQSAGTLREDDLDRVNALLRQAPEAAPGTADQRSRPET